jgi:hypothetical protein
MSDVTAVVLTLGEETTERALRSVAAQSLAAAEVVVVADTTPFHAALNRGASQVKTAYFVQVDADMVLDEHCFQRLRACMAPNVGVAAGHLRDTLIGRACCIKMFRRECFHRVQFRDSISPDTDFINDIAHYGWCLVYALHYPKGAEAVQHTLGAHCPEYTPQYTFSKYVMEGSRYRYRGDLGGLLWHLRQLRASRHSVALIAQAAMAHGVFAEAETDRLGRATGDSELPMLTSFLQGQGGCAKERLSGLPSVTGQPKDVLRRFVLLGMELRARYSVKSFEDCLQRLHESDQALAWVARVGLCHGLLAESYSREQLDKDYRRLCELLPEPESAAMLAGALRRLVRRLRDRRGSARFPLGRKP